MPETRDHVAECRELEAWLRDNAAVHSALSASARARMVERADSLAALLAEREWRPIAEAPRDGRARVMLSGGWMTVGSWNKHRGDWCISAPTYPPYPRDEQPTHYLPDGVLPAPPHPEE